MKLPNFRGRSALQFNITPLIDVVFLLIIFFLVASYFVKHEVHADVQLPEATQKDAEDESARRLVITVTADEQMLIGVRPVDLAEVERLIGEGVERAKAEFEVRIRGDRTVPYRAIEPILLECARAGVQRVRFAVEGVP